MGGSAVGRHGQLYTLWGRKELGGHDLRDLGSHLALGSA